MLEVTEDRGSLKPVLDAIPSEAYENPTWKGLSYFARDLALYLLVITLLILVDHLVAVVLLELVAALTVSGLFIVGHDAAHGALFRSRRLCSIVGHVAMLPAWHVFEGWVLGHNRVHHRFTVRQGFDFVWHPFTLEEYQRMPRSKRLLHRVEWCWAGVWIYYIREVWWSRMMVGRPPVRWRAAIHRDRAIVATFLVVSTMALVALEWAQSGTVAGAIWMVLRVLVVPFLLFSYMIGWFVHVHHIQPDIRWWGRREWTKVRGQLEGTTVFRVPPGVNFFIHWIMLHLPHHVDVRIPMYNLELAMAGIESEYPGLVTSRRMRFRTFIRTTRYCKLYSFETGSWQTYPKLSGS